MSDETEMVSNNEVLERLNACISTGQGTLGGALSVGIFDENAQAKLTKIIINAIKNRNNQEEVDRLNGINNGIANIGSQNNLLNKLFDRFIKEQRDKDKKDKGAIEKISSFIGKNIPIIGKVAKTAMNTIDFVYKQQIQWVNWYQQLNSSGILLNDGLKGLSEQANNAGVTIGEFAKFISSNSQSVAKLGSAFGNTTNSFSKYINLMNSYNKELVMAPEEIAKLSLSYSDAYAIYYQSQSNGMELLAEKTKNYLKYLDALSKATGRHKDQIDEETKRRETDLRWQVWMQDENNKKTAAAWNLMGLSIQQQQALAFGLPNKELTQLQLSSPEFVNFAEQIGSAKSDDERIEILGKLDEHFTKHMDEYKEELRMLRESGLLNADEDYVKFLAEGIMKGINFASSYNANEAEKVISGNYNANETEDRSSVVSAIEWSQKINEVNNSITDALRLDSELMKNIYTIEKQLTDDVIIPLIDTGKNWLLDPVKSGLNDLVKDIANLFKEDGKSLLDKFTSFMTKHPWFTGGTIAATILSTLSSGFQLLRPIYSILKWGFNLVKWGFMSVIRIIPTIATTLAPLLGFVARIGTIINTIFDIGGGFLKDIDDLKEKGWTEGTKEIERRAVLNTKDRGFWGRFFHPHDSLMTLLTSKERQIEILREDEMWKNHAASMFIESNGQFNATENNGIIDNIFEKFNELTNVFDQKVDEISSNVDKMSESLEQNIDKGINSLNSNIGNAGNNINQELKPIEINFSEESKKQLKEVLSESTLFADKMKLSINDPETKEILQNIVNKLGDTCRELGSCKVALEAKNKDDKLLLTYLGEMRYDVNRARINDEFKDIKTYEGSTE